MADQVLTLRGVDLAAFQGPPGEWGPEAGDIDWAAVKLTELEPDGNRYVNPDAAADWARLKAEAKARIAYLFGHPSTSTSATVSLFLSVLTELGLDDGDGVSIDIEETDGLSPQHVSAWTEEVAAALHAHLGRVPLIYTYRDFAIEGNLAGLGKYPLWISDPSSPAGHPIVPPPWREAAIHQYVASGAIDRDVTIGFANVAQMRQAFGRSGWILHTISSHVSLVRLAHECGTEPSTILRKTVEHFGVYEKPLLAYINAGNLRDPLPRGVKVMVPAGSLHVGPGPVRKAALAAVEGVKLAKRQVAKTVAAEPVMSSAAVLSGLSMLIAFALGRLGLHVDPTWKNAILTVLTALTGMYTAVKARPIRMPVIVAGLGTIATASATFGLHISAHWVAAEMPVISLFLGLLLRSHVSPKTARQLASVSPSTPPDQMLAIMHLWGPTVERLVKASVTKVLDQFAPPAPAPAAPSAPPTAPPVGPVPVTVPTPAQAPVSAPVAQPHPGTVPQPQLVPPAT